MTPRGAEGVGMQDLKSKAANVSAVASLLVALNGYSGDNLWQDVIECIAYDREVTEGADPFDSNDVVVMADGTELRFSYVSGEWEEA